ncbi:MAG: DUF3644 domain-containing protein [Acetobacter sp.]|nr:DUF3644 domain-containing protein [Acetobacter sp.]
MAKHNRNSKGSLTEEEQRIIKALLDRKWRNQDIQDLINRGRPSTINSARITEVKQNNLIKPASENDVDFFIQKKESYDQKTGLNYYDDERLIRSREAMILAVQIFNSPAVVFKTEIFSVLACIAWTYLLHEYYEKKKELPIIKDKEGRTLLLSQMLKHADFPLSKGIKNNLEAIIKIRNEVEHILLRKGEKNFYPLFQACCLNFDQALCELFGEKTSLRNDLSFALQFSRLNLEQVQTFQRYDLTPELEALDANLQKDLSDDEKRDLAYQINVCYTLLNTSKSKAYHQFIDPISREEKEIHNVLIQKEKVSSDELYPYKPRKICSMIKENTKEDFTIYNHTQAVYLYEVRPTSKSERPPEDTHKDYCIYHKAHKDYTYSKKWLDFLEKKVRDKDEFSKIKSFKIKKD